MLEPITQYHKLVFRTQKDADHAVTLLLDRATIDVSSREGPNRILVWQEALVKGTTWPSGHEHFPSIMGTVVYVSSGALERLERLMAVPLPPSEVVQAADLPKRLMMMVGDAEYWGWAKDSLDP